MSQSQFDPNVTLEIVPPDGAVAPAKLSNEFTATGPLGEDQRKQGDALRVLVSIWQTREDTEGGSAQDIVARALGVGGKDAIDPTKWSARLVMRGNESFKVGSPATGIGLAVGNNGDPDGFETYTWTKRLRIGVQPKLP